jgi:MFS family permease
MFDPVHLRKPLFISLVATLGGFLSGYMASITTFIYVQDFFLDTFCVNNYGDDSNCYEDDALPSDWVSFLTRFAGIFYIGEVAGFISSAIVNDLVSRRFSVFFFALLFTIGSIWSSLSSSVPSLLAGRLLVGVGVGGSMSSSPIYVNEIAPPDRRGQYSSFMPLSLTAGIVFSSFTNWIWENSADGFRYCLFFPSLFSLLILVSYVYLFPPSPRKLCSEFILSSSPFFPFSLDNRKQRSSQYASLATIDFKTPKISLVTGKEVIVDDQEEKAVSTSTTTTSTEPLLELSDEQYGELHFLLRDLGRETDEEAHHEIVLMLEALVVELNLLVHPSSSKYSHHHEEDDAPLFALFKNVSLRYRLFICATLQFFQQLLGFQMILLFGIEIFEMVGVHLVYVGYFLVSIVNFYGTYICNRGVDKQGRVILLSRGALGILISNIGALGCLYIGNLTDSESQSSGSSLEVVSRYLFGVFIMTLAYFHSISMGPISWVYSSEVFNFQVRSTAMSTVSVAHGLSAYLSTYSLSLIYATSLEFVFVLLVVISLLCFLFIQHFIVETKGVPLEKMDALFDHYLDKEFNIKHRNSQRRGGAGEGKEEEVEYENNQDDETASLLH